MKIVLKKAGFTALFLIEMMLIAILGQFAGKLIISGANLIMPDTAVWQTASLYFATVGTWIIILLYLFIIKKNRPILKSFGTSARGNNVKNSIFGLIIGVTLNGICVLTALKIGSIKLSFNEFNPVYFLVLFVAVFIQSSSEEAILRGLFYQRLNKLYNKPVIAIVLNSVLFSVLHFMNPGINAFAIINTVLIGILLTLPVYYMDSIWCSFFIHLGWNFTQSILFGLPNSGILVPYSIFKANTDTAVNSFAYDVYFGIEGTLLAGVAITVEIVIFLIIFALKGNKNSANIAKNQQ